MAVIQVAKIQVRRGQENQTGVPQLAGGEFAWAADTEKLYIGLRREDGGSRDANVEILTENSLRNFFSTVISTATYTYIYRDGSYITAIDGINETERTVQSKLDDIVSIKDFGAVGNGVLDDTLAIQVAVDNLFLNALDLPLSPAKKLYFPAGVYKISDTIYIPRSTSIVGEGPDKTIFNLISNGAHAFQTVDSRSQGVLLGGYITFNNAGSIDSNTQPDNVYIEGATIQYDATTTVPNTCLSLVSLDCANNAVIKNVKFKGVYSATSTTNVNYAGVDIRGYAAVTSENVLIDNCQFDGLYHGVKSNHDILNPIVNNSKFNQLHKGVSFCDPIDPLGSLGPRFGRILNNRFENIAAEAIYIGTNLSNSSTHHISMNNQFINVGNGNNLFGETSTTGTAVISFNSKNNASVNDYFDRYEYQMRNTGSEIRYKPLITGRATIDSAAGATTEVPPSASRCVMRLPITGSGQFLTIKYSAYNNLPVSRKGHLTVNISSGGNPAITITDDYNFNSSTDGIISWTAVVGSVNQWIEIRATNGSGNSITIECQSNLLL